MREETKDEKRKNDPATVKEKKINCTFLFEENIIIACYIRVYSQRITSNKFVTKFTRYPSFHRSFVHNNRVSRVIEFHRMARRLEIDRVWARAISIRICRIKYHTKSLTDASRERHDLVTRRGIDETRVSKNNERLRRIIDARSRFRCFLEARV